MDREAWQGTARGVVEGQTRPRGNMPLMPYAATLPLEEGMATHSSSLARRIPWTEDPGGLQSMGPQRVGEN